MKKMIVAVLFCAAMLPGCATMKRITGGSEMMGPPPKPVPTVELKRLDRLVGTWEGDATMVQPSVEEVRKNMPAEDAEKYTGTFKGGVTTKWTLGGMYLMSDGWHEMGPGEKSYMVEYWTWDPAAGKYRTFYFSDQGESGVGTAKWTSDNEMYWEGSGHDAWGNRSRLWGTMTFVDDNTMVWNFTQKGGPMGTMKFTGTSKKK